MRPDMHPYIHAQRHPDKPAYIMAGSGETVTYRYLTGERFDVVGPIEQATARLRVG